jgi:glutamate--cysteine ligase
MTTHRSRASGRGRLSAAAAEAWIPRTCFKHGPPTRVGVELELLVHDRRHPGLPTDGAAFDPLRRAAREAPTAGRVTLEPGGQLELSSTPHDGLIEAVAEVGADLARLRTLAAEHGARLVGRGVDDRQVRRRVLDDPRYTAMEAYLESWGAAGRAMMRRTASLQVNLEASGGDPGDLERRWSLLHSVGPPLVAAFANSPGVPHGPWPDWRCSRMGVWLAIDPARTSEPTRRPGEPLAGAWARWCLDAPLMLVRRPDAPWTAPRVTFREWLDAGQDVVPDRSDPDLADLSYHLTTLFPPVRARGHLEVRYLDAQPGDWWPVPVAVLWALVTDPTAGRRAVAASAAHRGRWRDAARHGLRDDALARAALAVLDAAVDALRARPESRDLADLVRAYRDRWTVHRRSPADDPIEDAIEGLSEHPAGPPSTDAFTTTLTRPTGRGASVPPVADGSTALSAGPPAGADPRREDQDPSREDSPC